MEPGARRRPLRDRLTGLVLAMFVLLAIQNLAGTWLNLYVRLTDTTSFGGVFPAMFASAAGAVHALVGILIGLNAILLLALASRQPDRRLTALAAGVLALVAIAAYSGFHFVASSGEDTYSFVMESAFVGIVLLEAVILAMLRSPGPAGAPRSAPGLSLKTD